MRYLPLCTVILALCAQVHSQPEPAPIPESRPELRPEPKLESRAESVAGVEAFDTPNDAGGSITVTWPKHPEASASTMYTVFLADAPSGPFLLVATVGADGSLKSDNPGMFGHDADNSHTHFAHIEIFPAVGEDEGTPLIDGKAYYVKVGLSPADDSVIPSSDGFGVPSGNAIEAVPGGNFFNWAKLNNFILGTFICLVILGYISVARRKELYIRRIAGLEAIDEALGRATEMGKPVLFVHGLKGMESIPTIAAVNILSRVARRTARLGTDLRVVNNEPIVMAVSQEVVKEAYLEEGRPDAYNPDSVFMAAPDQFSYAAAVAGMMVRDRPAAHIMMGYFYAESLLLAETGSTTGAIQIAGTDAYTQLPFFVTTCDYTLMGEELYAASAYLSREPRLLGSLKGQDVGKLVLIFGILVGTLMATFQMPFLTHLFTSY